MIKIYTKQPKLPEFKWVIGEIFTSFLGIEYMILHHDFNNIIIEFENKKKIEINNIFFNEMENEKDVTLPNTINLVKIEFINKYFNLPILYGHEKITFHNSLIKCEIDLIGFIFFKLSCFEEIINKKRDKLNRFLGKYSLFSQHNLNSKPVVNEYLDLLKFLILQLEPNLKFKKFHFYNLISCDIDCPYSHGIKSLKAYLRQIGGDILKRKAPILALCNTINPIFFKFQYYNFDAYINGIEYIIKKKQDYKNRLIFNIIPKNRGYFDQYYSIDEPVMDYILKKIIKSNSEIGVHLSTVSSQNLDLALEDVSKIKCLLENYGYPFSKNLRNHYLIFDIRDSLQILDKLDLYSDSTLGYPDTGGFRSGTCYPYYPYNFVTKSAAKFIEYPLHIMDVTLFNENYMCYEKPEDALEYALKIKNECRKYNGFFSLLWHNNNLLTKHQKFIYNELIKI